MTAEWRINHEHNGLEVEFSGKPSQAIRDQLKANGFRWSGSSGVWYAKDCAYRREFLSTIATQGPDVEASGKSFADRMEEKAGRAEARRERLETAAERADAEASRRFTAAHDLVAGIPMGQPILVGHYSERHHRRTLERSDTNMRKGIEASKKADYLSTRATSAGSQLEGYDRPDFLQRRIRECEAEIRRLDRNKARYAGELDNWRRYRDEAQSKLDFCRQRLEELGGAQFGPHNVKPGDYIAASCGVAIVRRVNPKSLTVDYLNPAIAVLNPAKEEYGRVKAILTPEQVQQVKEAQQKRKQAN